MMEINKERRDIIIEVVENQIDANDPVEVRITYNRLVALGYSDFETKQLIGQCVAVEIYDVIKEQKPFDEVRYVKNLNHLPKAPFD
jgi:hypothetical protein